VEVVVTVLALLEILRRRLASARQSEAMGPIMIYRTVERVDEAPAPADAAVGALPGAEA
jgi:chromatin segregation and condensation protein Rec8/ScpA/Scc1 (kleisin family)